MRRRALLALAVVAALLIPIHIHAADAGKGLQVDPLRHFFEMEASTAQDGFVTIGNQTDKPIDVALSIQSFKLADFTYQYQFENPQYDWVTLGASNVHLDPGQGQKVAFHIAIPDGATAGGQYFSIFAITDHNEGDIKTRLQVSSVIFITVKGVLVQTAELADASISPLTFTGKVPYTLDVRDTGNIHFFMYTTIEASGPFAAGKSQGPAQLLMPGTVRRLSSEFTLPSWPGLYKVSYGYVTDGNQTATRTAYVWYLPPWLMLIPLALIAVLVFARRFRRR